ncbi:hypothetical protein KDX14_27805 [Burkholderia cenocepacia]|uniref:hypothetical protein n=1 Tax=Burkholderia cepacia complex TaxID=87882 RepID=UPI000F5A5A77|nr:MULTISPECIES: hypothetical protein [Burkholderia cepacia complex]MBR8073336.1 hypothetical protein [Burkholderia cenocepacia]
MKRIIVGLAALLVSLAALGQTYQVQNLQVNGSATIPAGAINGTTIGGSAPSSGAFTTLQATGTVSGVGFANYLAAPPVIGGTTPNNAAFAQVVVNGNAAGIAKFGATSDWLSPIINCTTNCATAWSLSPSGYLALVGGSRTSDNTLAGSQGTIGVAGYALNNNTTQVMTGYAGYFEARATTPGVGITQGVEIDMVNQGTSIAIDPYNMQQTGETPALWLSSGRPDVTAGAVNASAAIGIINNHTAFNDGIVFGSNSLAVNSGEAEAILMGPNHALSWYASAGTIVSRIRSDATSASLGLIFANGQLNFSNMAGVQKVSIDTSGNVTAVGNVSADGTSYMLGNISGQTLPGDATTTGTSSIGWNRQSGSGETDFINAKGGGSAGGFAWWQWNGSATTQTANLDATGNFSAGATINTASYTVAGLPPGVIGRRAIVTNATSCTFMGAITGGGSTFCPVIYNGTAWVGG